MNEIERRFLLKYIPDFVKTTKGISIEDYMILTGEDHPHLRLRKIDDRYELTKKYPKPGATNAEKIEETIILSEVEFNAFKKLDHKGQQKLRYKIVSDNYSTELDLWQGELQGLGIVEFEFHSVEAAQEFIPPEYILCEVTGLEWLAGGKISGKSYEDIALELEKLGYKKLD